MLPNEKHGAMDGWYGMEREIFITSIYTQKSNKQSGAFLFYLIYSANERTRGNKCVFLVSEDGYVVVGCQKGHSSRRNSESVGMEWDEWMDGDLWYSFIN